MASAVARETPPNVVDEGDGRTNACACLDNCCMRVLSPRSAPLVRLEEGSTARTATFHPFSIASIPNRSMSVLFPAPGIPVMPMRRASVRSAVCSRSCSIWGWCSRLVLSTHVMAWARASRLPDFTAFANVSTVQDCPFLIKEDAASLASCRAFSRGSILWDMFGRYVKG